MRTNFMKIKLFPTKFLYQNTFFQTFFLISLIELIFILNQENLAEETIS